MASTSATGNINKGTWSHPVERRSFLEAHKTKIIVALALIALGALANGGVLEVFKDIPSNLKIGLFAGGGTLLIASAIARFRIFLNRQTSSYNIVTWNIGTWNDFRNMNALKNLVSEELPLGQALQQWLSEAPRKLTEEEKTHRITLLQTAFQQFNNPDIIVIQEMYELKEEELKLIIPEGYKYFSYSKNQLQDCMVIWKDDKFSALASANVSYHEDYIGFNSAPDTIVLLQDQNNGTTICVNSAHLRGFSLAAEESEKTQRAKTGDYQTRYDLGVMDEVDADLYIFAGDFNVTRDHYQTRLDIIEGEGYKTDLTDTSPTMYDANLKESDMQTPAQVKLDHIYAREGYNARIKISSAITATSLNNFDRPSDHLPVRARVQVTTW